MMICVSIALSLTYTILLYHGAYIVMLRVDNDITILIVMMIVMIIMVMMIVMFTIILSYLESIISHKKYNRQS